MAAKAGHPSSKKKSKKSKKPKRSNTTICKLDYRADRFVEEYLKDLNGTRAATVAGYSPRSAAQAATQLLKNPNVQAKLMVARRRIANKAELTVEMIVAELRKSGFSNLGDYYLVAENGEVVINQATMQDPDATAALAEISIEQDVLVSKKGRKLVSGKIKIKPYNKHDALDKLGRHLGMWPRGDGPDGSGKNSETREIVIKGGLPSR